ncbi:MAG: hypothetical protein H6726_32295 [Sandaracinaceae bacterium]|nr:hypothetical protein [Sandaracinaceae bacterium]
MTTVRWLDEALLEAEETARYYAEIDIDLGDDLWSQVRTQIALCDRFPRAGVRVERVADVDVRRFLTDRFPYAVVLARLEDELVVIALHHQHRRPGDWKRRLAKVLR